MGVVTDISALKEAQRPCRKTRLCCRVSSRRPVGISFGEGRVLKWTNEYRQISGYGRETLEGNSARILYDNDEEYLRVGEAFYRGIDERGIGEPNRGGRERTARRWMSC